MVRNTTIEIDRVSLEEALAYLVDAEQLLMAVSTRLARFAKVDIDAENLKQTVDARRQIERARQQLVKFHPDRRAT